MKNIATASVFAIVFLIVTGCTGGHRQESTEKATTAAKTLMLPTTPLKDQGHTELCWIYAALAAIETDRIAAGDSVNLSVAWVERQALCRMATENYLASSNVSLRGTLIDAVRLIAEGLVPYDSYRGKEHSTSELCRKVTHLAQTFASQKKGLKALEAATTDLLDTELGAAPYRVYMLGAEYTPREFSHSVFLASEWHAVTSFSHHPYGSKYDMELHDAHVPATALNVRPLHMLKMVKESLHARHPVMWEGTMNNRALKNIKAPQGLTAYDADEYYAQHRQRALERHELTDNHCMAIVGMDTAKDGTTTFICKNSWRGHGFVRMTEHQFLTHTMMIVIRRTC